jgi:hypothetical protein
MECNGLRRFMFAFDQVERLYRRLERSNASYSAFKRWEAIMVRRFGGMVFDLWLLN